MHFSDSVYRKSHALPGIQNVFTHSAPRKRQMDLTEILPSKIMFELEEISHFKVIEDNQEQYVTGKSNLTLLLLNILCDSFSNHK